MNCDDNKGSYGTEIGYLETAQEDIENAETEEDVAEALDTFLSQMEKVDEAIAALEEKKDAAIEDLQAYADALNDVKGMSAEDKSKVKTFVKQAQEAVKAANSNEEIEAATDTFNELMASFEEVKTAKEKAETLAALNDYLAEAEPGMKNVIEKAIDEVNKATTAEEVKNAVNGLLDEKTGKLPTLKEAQKAAYETLSAYEDYLAKNTVDGENLILGEIETVKAAIANAEDKSNVETAMDGFDNFMDDYEDTVTAVELEVAKNALDNMYKEVTAKLSPYVSSTDKNVKDLADAAVKLFDEIRKAGAESEEKDDVVEATNRIKDLFYGKGNHGLPAVNEDNYVVESNLKSYYSESNIVTNFLGYENALKHNAAKTEKDDKADKLGRAEAYKSAMEKLDLYTTVINDNDAVEALKLTEQNVASIKEMINSTKTSVEKAEGKTAVDDAKAILDKYLNNYYEEFVEYAENYEFESTKTSALKELEAYKEQYKDVTEDDTIYAPVKDAVDDAITAIEALEADVNEVSEITEELETVKDAIKLANKQAELKLAVDTAVAKYTPLLKSESEEVKQAAAAAIKELSALKYNGSIKNTPKDVAKIEEKYDPQLKEALKAQEEKDKKERDEALEPIMDKVDELIEIATAGKRTEIVNQLNNFKSELNKTKTAEEVTTVSGQLNSYINESCQIVKAQYDAIYAETNGLLDKYEEICGKDEEAKAIVDKAIADIKAITETDFARAQEAINAIVGVGASDEKETVAKKIAKIQGEITNLDSKKDTAVENINDKIDEYPEDKAALKNIVQEYIDAINAVTRKDKNYATTIDNIVTEAEAAIQDYLDVKISNEAEKNLNIKSVKTEIGESTTFFESEKNVSDLQESVKIENGKVSGKLKEVTDFTQFGAPEGHKHFLALKFDKGSAERVEIQLVNGDESKTIGDLDTDGIVIISFKEEDQLTTNKMKVNFYNESNELVKTLTLDLSGLKFA